MRTDKAAQLEELRKLEKMCENGHGYASKIGRKRKRKRGRGRKNGGPGGKEKAEGRCGGTLSVSFADSFPSGEAKAPAGAGKERIATARSASQ